MPTLLFTNTPNASKFKDLNLFVDSIFLLVIVFNDFLLLLLILNVHVEQNPKCLHNM